MRLFHCAVVPWRHMQGDFGVFPRKHSSEKLSRGFRKAVVEHDTLGGSIAVRMHKLGRSFMSPE